MKRGELAKKKRKGCLTALLVVWAVFMVKVIAVLNPGFPEAWRMVEAGQIAGFAYIWLLVFLVLLCCCAVLSFGASSRKVTFGKRSRKRPVRLGNGWFRYPRMKTRLLSAILFGAYSSQGRQDRESPRVSQCPCSLSSSARDLPGSCTISSSRLLTMHFRQVDGQYRQSVGQQPDSFVSGADIMEYYNRVKEDIKGILGQS